MASSEPLNSSLPVSGLACEHPDLAEAVQRALFALPSSFQSELIVRGVLATDLFSFNSALGATIEAQVVDALNDLRPLWDPKKEYPTYRFVRQPQTFPDVVLKNSAPGIEPAILIGIELKGWYVLAKEREPSFRFKVSPSVCSPCDLLAVYPWALSEVISGSPKVFEPFVMSARQAAEKRNSHWLSKSGSESIELSTLTGFYLSKSELISDKPTQDGGGNFGRIARSGIEEFDAFTSGVFSELLAGVQLDAWQKFFAIFTESVTDELIRKRLTVLTKSLSKSVRANPNETFEGAKLILSQVLEMLEFETAPNSSRQST